MKQTLILTELEQAAWMGVMGDVTRAESALKYERAKAEKIVTSILNGRGIPFKGTVTGTTVDGQPALVYVPAEVPVPEAAPA